VKRKAASIIWKPSKREEGVLIREGFETKRISERERNQKPAVGKGVSISGTGSVRYAE
jgi:hypothetical protein